MNRLTKVNQETFDKHIRDAEDELVYYNRRSAKTLHADGGSDTEGNPIPLCFRYGQRFAPNAKDRGRILSRGYRERRIEGAPKWERKAMAVYPPGYRPWCSYCIDAWYRDHPDELPEGVELAETDLYRRETVEASRSTMVMPEEAWVPKDRLLKRRLSGGHKGLHTDGGEDR